MADVCLIKAGIVLVSAFKVDLGGMRSFSEPPLRADQALLHNVFVHGDPKPFFEVVDNARGGSVQVLGDGFDREIA